jgi:RND family efflux transporter MFP subunit
MAIAAAAVLGAACAPLLAEDFPGVSLPCKDVTMKFTRPGRLADVPVKENQQIKKGEVLARLDSAEEEKTYVQDKARADDNTKVEAQAAIRAHEEAKLAKIKFGREHGAASPFELDESKLSVLVEEAKVKLTNFEHAMEKLKAEQSKAVLDKMTLISPIDGQIERQFAKVGESVEPANNVVRLIDLSRLFIETTVAYDGATKLKTVEENKPNESVDEARAIVHFSDGSTAKGNVIYIAGVADAGSGTLLVRVEVENSAKRRAGDRVRVEFPYLTKIAAK